MRMCLRLLLAAMVLLAPVLLSAQTKLSGERVQGGLILGQTTRNSRVFFNKTALRVSKNGDFLFGFGRDAKPSAKLRVIAPDGSEETIALTIKKRDYKIQRINGLPSKMVTPPKSRLDRIRRENVGIAKARKFDTARPHYLSGFTAPAKGPISGVYGSQRVLNGKPRRPHFGIDYAAPEGAPVIAPSDGIVRLAERDLYYTGGTVMLDHGHGLSSAFLHMKSVAVQVGERVSQGQNIGTVGATGRATGPHLDWRVNWFKVRLDPALVLKLWGK